VTRNRRAQQAAKFREYIRAGIVDGKRLEFSFENFPYYLRYLCRVKIRACEFSIKNILV
jgi:hypothetical protein